MVETVLFPSGYFDAGTIDSDLRAEYEAALDTGLFKVILFSYEKWFDEGCLSLTEIPEAPIMAVYRGWMMKPEQYAAFYESLRRRNITLVTTPEMYSLFHVFPNIYPKLEADTAGMLTFPDGEEVDLEMVKRTFDRFMVKDYVKSVKGTDFPKFLRNRISGQEFAELMKLFYKYRGSLYTGGICIKEYLNLKKYGTHTNEYRVFYVKGIPVSVSRNSGQQSFAPEPPAELIEKYNTLDSCFYTIDVAELEDGSWKILEAGDGSVSGLSDGQDYRAFFRSLYHSLN